MGVSLKQPSMSGGLISTTILGRSDVQKYATGLRTCTNAWITRYGTLENRPGTVWDAEVKDSSRTVREVPFIFSSLVSYLLEFGENYIRPYKNGARISVTGADAYSALTTYSKGDLVTSGGMVYYSRVDANLGNTPATSPTQWYLEANDLLEIPTDIPQAALADFQYVQQNDVMTLTSRLFHPKQLSRFSDTRWVFEDFAIGTDIDAPTNVQVTPGVAPGSTFPAPGGIGCLGGISTGTLPDRYFLLGFDGTYAGDSAEFISTSGPDFEATAGNPITISWNVVPLVEGYALYKKKRSAGPGGIIAVIYDGTATGFVDNGYLPANPVAIVLPQPTGATPFVYVVTAVSDATGVETVASAQGSATGGTPTDDNPNVITWTTVTGALTYRVYRIVNGVPGFVGETPTPPFRDPNIIPDTAIQPPENLTLFTTSNDWPAVCGFYQQRLCFANTVNQPQTEWMSRVGSSRSFTVSTPVQDDDAIQFTIAGRQVQEIRAVVDLGKQVIHTSNAEYTLNGNQAGTVTPSELGLVANGSSGSTFIIPVVLGNTDLFVQEGATRLLDIRWNVQSFSYDGKDLTKYAAELFVGRTIVDMAWQKLPHSIVWCVLDNGQMLGMTYVREDELWAWHVHESTNGAFENVCVVPEGSEQIVYVVVRREINGQTKRYIEQLADRSCIDQTFFTDSIFADASLTYDGRNSTTTTITVTTGTAWTPTSLLTLTASASLFDSSWVGDTVVFRLLDDETSEVTDVVTFQVTGFTSATVITGNATRDVPTWAQATAVTTWGHGVTEFSGMDHLEGEDMAVLADGTVVANPLDPGYTTVVTVSGGAFTLTQPAVVVTAGLPIQMDVQTLPLENAAGDTIANRRVVVRRSTPIFHQSRGGSYGQDFSHLNAWKVASPAPFGYPPAAVTGAYSVPINGTPQNSGQICVRLTDPVPWGISGVVLTGEIGDAT